MLIFAKCRPKALQNAPREHSAILSTFIKLPFVFKTIVLYIFEWPLKSGFTVYRCTRRSASSFTRHNDSRFNPRQVLRLFWGNSFHWLFPRTSLYTCIRILVGEMKYFSPAKLPLSQVAWGTKLQITCL